MTRDFIGFEEWPPEKLIDETIKVCVEDAKADRRDSMFAVSLCLGLVESMILREDDLAVARSRITEWRKVAEAENFRLFNITLDEGTGS